jgi:hypothetical protein
MIKLIFLNLIIIIIIIILFFVKFNNILDETQQELVEQGWELYTIENCLHCKTQLDDVPKFKNYIMFSKNGILKKIPNNKPLQDIVKIENIYSFPCWYNTKTKKKIYGVSDIKSILSIYAKKEQ